MPAPTRIVIETMTDPAEARLAVAAAKETGLPVVACMTFDSGAKLDRTMMGTTPEQAAEQLLEAGADVIGSNCGQGVAGFVEICRRLHAASGRPVWVKANAGLPEMRDGKTHYAQTAEQFAAYVPQLVAAGAGFIGGCCGTSPEFICAICGKVSGEPLSPHLPPCRPAGSPRAGSETLPCRKCRARSSGWASSSRGSPSTRWRRSSPGR